MTWAERRLIVQKYVYENKSLSQVSTEMGYSKAHVHRTLKFMKVELRSRTLLRICRIPGCGKECFKRLCKNGRTNGRVLSGGLCHEHAIENLARKFKAMYSKTQEHQQGEPKPINGHAGV
jgi:hypothetical protein